MNFERIQDGRPALCRPGVIALLLCAGVLLTGTSSAFAEEIRPVTKVKAVIIPIHGEITDVTADSVRRRIDDAKSAGATLMVFELDTPGGLVTSSIAIADQIKLLNDAQPEIHTVAWVNTNAHSGGSIVAVAADEIVMARSSRMGDSQVIMGGPDGMQAVPEDLQAKAYSPVLTEFRASARLNGYDPILCEAMVIPEREVWWLENTRTGEREFVFRDEKLRRMGEKEDRPTKKIKPAETDEAEGEAAAPDKSDEAEATVPPVLIHSDAQVGEWKLVATYRDVLRDVDVDVVQPVVRADELLEMSQSEATAYGFCKAIVTTDDQLRGRYTISEMVRLQPTWSEALAFWLTSMYVRGFLMVLILLGAYVEFHTPGVGLPGLVALIALGIFVGAPYLTGLASIWEIILIVMGFVLIAVEVFLLPGFGIAGVSGAVLLLVGLVATFVPDEPGRFFPLFVPSLPGTIYGLKVGLATVVGSLGTSLIGMFILSRYLPRLPVFNRIVAPNPTPSDVLVEDPYRGQARVGDRGETEGPLRPAGKARFGMMLVDVVTEGEFLESRTPIEVIERRGNRVVVRPARA